MIKDITLGQFFPGNSVFHRADPRIKTVAMVLFVVSVFFADNLLSYALLLLGVISSCLLSQIELKVILKGLKPVLFIAVFMGFINVFFTKGQTLLLELGIVRIYSEGLISAVFIMIRLFCLVGGTGILLTYTTSPNVLCDAIESLLSPLKRIRVPVHDFAMMMTIALRFIPTLIEETDKIMSAQKARGADFESGNLLKRAKALLPILIPLLVSSIRRASELAVAMECRCYAGGEGRTKLKRLHLRFSDWIFLLAFVLFGAALIVLSNYDLWGL